MKWQLLHKACWAGDAEEVERLLAVGADPNQVAPTNWRQTPLGRTLDFRITSPKHAGHVAVVQALLKAGANPSVRSTSLDMTPWELACFCGLEEAASLLERYQDGASPHPSGMTRIWLTAASRLDEARVLKALKGMRRRGDLNVVWRRATPLMMAAAHAQHFRVADLLLEWGADLNAGTSLLHASCDWHFPALIPALDYMAGHGWRVNGRDSEGQTALDKAVMLRYPKVVRALQRLGATPAPVPGSKLV